MDNQFLFDFMDRIYQIQLAYIEAAMGLVKINNNPPNVIAVYAAFLSTVLAIWEWMKWRNRFHVKVLCYSNRMFYPSDNANKFITLEAINRGQNPTTITNFIGFYYKNIFNRVRRKKDIAFVIPHKSIVIKSSGGTYQYTSDDVPKYIKQGELWRGFLEQNDEVNNWAKNGFLYLGITHTLSDKEIISRVRMAKKQNETP